VADLLEQAVSWLDGMRQSHLSRAVTYQRGDDSVEVAATLGATSYDVADEAGATVEAKATDFIVAANALILGGVQVAPRVGDRIQVATAEMTLTYEVLALGGTAHYRPCDPAGRLLRIHAKVIGEEAA
jgi:hypothetical protein